MTVDCCAVVVPDNLVNIVENLTANVVNSFIIAEFNYNFWGFLEFVVYTFLSSNFTPQKNTTKPSLDPLVCWVLGDFNVILVIFF